MYGHCMRKMDFMRPLTVITGILLGTCLSISFSLAAVLVIFHILSDDYPRLSHEYAPLIITFGLFTVMTAICAASFYALVKDHRARWVGQAFMWSGLLSVGMYYWP